MECQQIYQFIMKFYLKLIVINFFILLYVLLIEMPTFLRLHNLQKPFFISKV